MTQEAATSRSSAATDAAGSTTGSPAAPPDDAAASEGKKRRPFWRRRRFWGRFRKSFVFTLGILMLTAYLVVGYFTDPERIRQRAEQAIAKRLGVEVSIREAFFEFNGTLGLKGVELRLPADAAPEQGSGDGKAVASQPDSDGRRLATVDSIIIDLDTDQLLGGVLTPLSIVVDGPRFFVTEDTRSNRFTFQSLQREQQPKGEDAVRVLPEVHVNRAELVMGEIDAAGSYRQDATLTVDAQLLAGRGPGAAYTFLVTQRQGASKLGPTLRGRFDPKSRTFDAALHHLEVDHTLKRLLPAGVRKAHRELSLTGKIDTAELKFAPDAGSEATVHLRDVGLRLPVEHLEQCELTHVNGRIDFKNKRLTFDLSGHVNDPNYRATCRVKGHIDELAEDAPFDIDFLVDEAELFKKPTDLPASLDNALSRYSPTGKFKAAIKIKRTGDSPEVLASGAVDLLNMRGIYRPFPYPLEQVTGKVTFRPGMVEIIDVRGVNPNGARVTLSGTVSKPDEGGEVLVAVDAENVPLDAALFTALEKGNPKAINTIKQYQHEGQYQALVDKGLIQSTAMAEARWGRIRALQKQLTALGMGEGNGGGGVEAAKKRIAIEQQIARLRELAGAPVFDLGGRTAVKVIVTRSADKDGVRGRWGSAVTAQVKGMPMLYEHWPYPLRVTGGEVFIEGKQIELRDISATGLAGGGGMISGTITPIDIRMRGGNFPLDELLLATIKPPQDDWVRRLRLQGRVGFDGVVERNAAGGVTYRINTLMHGATATPNGGRFALSDLDLDMTVAPGRVDIRKVTAKHNDSTVTLSGTQTADGLDLHIQGKALRFENPVLDLIPPGLEAAKAARELHAKHNPRGRFDADVKFKLAGGGDDAPSFLVSLDPAQLSFERNDRRHELTAMTGQVLVTPDRLELRRLGMTLGRDAVTAEGTASLNGWLSLKPGNELSLEVGLNANRLGPAIRSVLPEGLLTVIDGLQLKGPISLNDGVLAYTPPRAARADHAGQRGDASPAMLSFDGSLQLRGAQVDIGVPVSKLDATLKTKVRHTFPLDAQGKATTPRIDLEVLASTLVIEGRQIKPLRAIIANTDARPDLIAIKDIKASMYGGVLIGEGALALGEKTRYSIDLKLQEVAFSPLFSPEKFSWPPVASGDVNTNSASSKDVGKQANGKDPGPPTGLVSASLRLEGFIGDPRSKRGRGELRVSDAKLFELPIALSVLHVLNFAPPGNTRFDRASAKYLLEGDRMKLDSVSMQSPSIQLAGDGYMDIPSKRIDLLLYTSNPSAPRVAVISDIFDVIKDSLISIHVTGTLAEPSPSVLSLRGVRRTWDQVFGRLGRRKANDPKKTND